MSCIGIVPMPRESGPDCLCWRGPIAGATSYLRAPYMIVYTVNQNANDGGVLYGPHARGWPVPRYPAITQARDAGRPEHLGSGLTTRVEMHSDDTITPPTSYQ
jgi:hypothetical protein